MSRTAMRNRGLVKQHLLAQATADVSETARKASRLDPIEALRFA